MRPLHGHREGHEDDRRPLPGRARTLAGAQRRRRGAAAHDGAGEEGRSALAASTSRPTQEVLTVRASPDPEEAARGEREARLMAGPGAALGQGPQGRLPDDQRESREPRLQPRLRAAGRQVPPPLSDRRRRLLRVDAGRGPQAAAPALALHRRRRRAVRLRRDLHPQGVGRRGGPRLRRRLALQLHDRHHDAERARRPRPRPDAGDPARAPRPRRPGCAPTSASRTRSRCARRCRPRGCRAPRPTRG